ncbi:phenylacetate--CoA ligase family protein [Gemmobacter sp.]|uniref:phenylacetate--CoA ligase family protein n=1 Tax=Gemmobacter sp. TaxID=1898957 RepID=UPI002AFFEE8F|nr:AMP-binding protein [Gemmobacter sp.]
MTTDDRTSAGMVALAATIRAARAGAPWWAARLPDPGPGPMTPESLAALPVLRKSQLPALQAADLPFGGLAARPPAGFARLFLSPGPICEPGEGADTGAARALQAAGFGAGDILLNTFGYHLTPAGLMFDDAGRAAGGAVIPAGGGNTDQIVTAMRAYRPTAYAGTADYLNILLTAADAAGVPVALTRAFLSGAAVTPTLRAAFTTRGIAVFELYGTAELGILAYETPAHQGMVLNDGFWAEIVAPGTGDPLPQGEVGELVVTLYRTAYPLIRFATGDLTAILPSADGVAPPRLRGWMGRADDAVKVKGMFLRPGMLADVLATSPVTRARFVVDRVDERDRLTLEVEGAEDPALGADLQRAVRSVTRLGCDLRWCAPGSIPQGPALADLR